MGGKWEMWGWMMERVMSAYGYRNRMCKVFLRAIDVNLPVVSAILPQRQTYRLVT